MLYKIEKNHVGNIFIAVMMMLELNRLGGNMCNDERRVDATQEDCIEYELAFAAGRFLPLPNESWVHINYEI